MAGGSLQIPLVVPIPARTVELVFTYENELELTADGIAQKIATVLGIKQTDVKVDEEKNQATFPLDSQEKRRKILEKLEKEIKALTVLKLKVDSDAVS